MTGLQGVKESKRSPGWKVWGWVYPFIWWARRKPRSRQWVFAVTDWILWKGTMRRWRRLTKP